MHYGFSEGYKPHLNGDYPIYTQTSFSDKITENTKEKGRREHMSFVGLTFFKDHIIGYGDTKSSRFVDGAFQDDKKRQRVLKIFKTRDYIVCTYDKYPYGKPQTDEVDRGSGNREYGCRRLREKLPNFSGVSFF